jgi:saccharopine dehydrogenase (NAD+, L-lysine-forming)
MIKTIGIRREDKNEWERRVPLVPGDVAELGEKYGIKTIIQPSEVRIFSDDEYQKAGAEIGEDLQGADAIFAVKEIPLHLLEHGKTYIFFSHTIKGQPYNMKMLKRLMELECNLIDYELIAGRKNNRLITFSSYAGMAGLIETLHAYGRKMKLNGYVTPFEEIKQAYQYNSLEEAKNHLRKIGGMITEKGFPEELAPLTVGFLGYGNVSKGAQEMFDLLPLKTIEPKQLDQLMGNGKNGSDNRCLYKVIFKEEDIVKPLKGAFDLQEYYDHPDRFESNFHNYLPYLEILINCVYWTEKYPRFVTKENLKKNVHPGGESGLKVIGDITCDINGSIEITRESTMPDKACYTYYVENDSYADGIKDSGITVMAIDNLPCEFPREASVEFSQELKTFVNGIVTADFKADFNEIELPYEIKKATILHKGRLTGKFDYMNEFL